MATATMSPRTRSTSGGFAHEMRAVRIVWQREMIRFWQDRARLVVSFVQPLLFLFVLYFGIVWLLLWGLHRQKIYLRM